MNVFDLFAKLSLDSSEYEKGLTDAENKGSKFGAGLKKAGTVAAGAVAAASGAVVAFAGDSVKAGMNFDSAMSQVAATMGTTTDQIGDLRAFAQEMGSTTAFSATQAAEALNYMALAGYDSEKSMEMLPSVLNLAAAGGMDLATASDMVTDASSALGLSSEQTSAMIDQMAAASSKSNTSVSQLGEAMLAIGPTAQLLSGGTTELSTALGILADNGIKGAEGGTKLRNVLLSLANPTDAGADALEALGVDAYDAAGQLKPMEEIMGDLNKAMNGFTDAQRTQVIGQIFNKADLAAVNSLLNTSAERWDELGSAIDSSAGAADAMANTQLDNLQGDITLFQSALEGAQIALSDQLTPQLREFVQFGSDGISRLTQAFQEGGLSGAMGELGGILSDAIGMIIQSLPDIVDAGMQLLGALVQGIIDNLPQVLEAAKKIILMISNTLAEHAPEIIPTIVGLILTIVTALTDPSFLTELLQAGIQIVMGLIQGILQAIPMIIEQLPIIIDNICQFLIQALPLLMEAGLELFNGIIEAIPVIIDALGEALPQIIQTICDLIIAGMPMILQGAIQLLMAIVQAIPTIIQALTQNLPMIINSIVTTLANNFPAILQGAIELLMGIISAIPEIVSQLNANMPQIITSIMTGLLDGIPTIINAGVQLIQGLWQGISSVKDWIMGKVKGFMDGIVGGIKDFFGIHSPSTLFRDDIGKNLALGLGEGFEETLPETLDGMAKSASDAAGQIADAMTEPFDDMSLSSGVSMDGYIKSTGGFGAASENSNMLERIGSIIDERLSNISFTINNPVYIGQKKIEQQVKTATAHGNLISGGR